MEDIEDNKWQHFFTLNFNEMVSKHDCYTSAYELYDIMRQEFPYTMVSLLYSIQAEEKYGHNIKFQLFVKGNYNKSIEWVHKVCSKHKLEIHTNMTKVEMIKFIESEYNQGYDIGLLTYDPSNI